MHRQPAYAAQRLRLVLLSSTGAPEMLLSRTFRVRGPLDVDRLEQAVARLVMRRDSLRSRFEMRGGVPWQCFPPPGGGPSLRIIDLPGDEEAALAWIDREIHAPIDIWAPEQARIGLVRVGPEDHYLALCVSHLVSDGWTMNLIVDDLADAYRGTDPTSAPAFAQWARLRGARLLTDAETDRLFWRSVFPDPPPVLGLPVEDPARVAPADPVERFLDATTVARLQQLAAHHRTSLYSVVLAAVHTVIAEPEGEELTYTVSVANRDDQDAQNTVGCLTHRALLRIGRNAAPDLPTRVDDVRATLLSTLEHAHVPFRILRSWLQEWHGTEPPEAGFVYVVLSEQWGGDLDLADLEVTRHEPEVADDGSAGLEFWFTLAPEDGMTLRIRYPWRRFDRHEIDAVCEQVVAVLEDAGLAAASS